MSVASPVAEDPGSSARTRARGEAAGRHVQLPAHAAVHRPHAARRANPVGARAERDRVHDRDAGAPDAFQNIWGTGYRLRADD